jgi:hypothetical protein
MKHSWMVIALPLALAGCGDADETQKDPVDVTPPAQSSSPEPAPNTAPAERDPTPQTGTGGDSPSTAPSGTNSPPSGQP